MCNDSHWAGSGIGSGAGLAKTGTESGAGPGKTTVLAQSAFKKHMCFFVLFLTSHFFMCFFVLFFGLEVLFFPDFGEIMIKMVNFCTC